MSNDQQRRWCVFTSAGDRNAVRLWLAGDSPRRWDLVIAYYGDNDEVFAQLSELCSCVFKTKGSKYQNLKKLVLSDPQFFDQYSHVWACDDDILMSSSQINEAFEITETLGFWVTQPATRAEGKNGHWITCYAGTRWDYRIVNFVENGLAIFRREKLLQFLAVYDGSLAGWGIDHWYANLFRANEFGRFAVIDKVQVINPRSEMKGGNEMNRLQPASAREADWHKVRKEQGLIEYPPKVYAFCKLPPKRERLHIFLDPGLLVRARCSRRRAVIWLLKNGLVGILLETLRRDGWREVIWLITCGLTIIHQGRAVN